MLINYKEDLKASNSYRQDYLSSVEELVQSKLSASAEERFARAKDIINDPEGARNQLREMIGWPLTEPVRQPISVTRERIKEENGVCLYRMCFEVFEGFHFYGLFFEHVGQKLPFVITQHGYGGTSEQCSHLFEMGTVIYNDMSQRIAEKQVHVFVPQLLMWFPDRYGIEHNRVVLDAKLKQIGGSITALEIYCLQSCISYFETLSCVEKDKMGMIGLSYGGYFTLYTSALDTRLKAALSCCYFNDRTKFIFPDWTWKHAAKSFLDSEVALLLHPRKLWIGLGSRDDVIDPKTGKEEHDRLMREIASAKIDDRWLSFAVYEGGHEFCPDDTLIDEFMTALKQNL